jgi:RimJ/RimL family protein N-acetyltransferase
MLIRYAKPDYANRLTDLIKQVEESNFMLFEPGERKTSPEQLRKRIESMEEDETSEMLIAEENDSLIGYLFVIGGNPNRSKHSVYIVIGVSEEYRGKGVGTMLFQELDKWAIQKNIHRLELTVMEHNLAGIHLYTKMGFEKEGTKRHSLFVNGRYVNEFYMSKLI